jgi:hypothetical protein
LSKILEYYTTSQKDSIGFIPLGTIKYEWFYAEFNKADGLRWLPLIILNRPSCIHAVLQLLVDQIVFSSASEDINTPLSCTYQCIQVFGSIFPSGKPYYARIANSGLSELANLRDALLWVLRKSMAVREHFNTPRKSSLDASELPHFATIAIKKRRRYGIQDGEARSFDFVMDMSDGRWDEWKAMLRTMVMGISLGGLGVETSRTNRVEDPIGICAPVSSSDWGEERRKVQHYC